MGVKVSEVKLSEVKRREVKRREVKRNGYLNIPSKGKNIPKKNSLNEKNETHAKDVSVLSQEELPKEEVASDAKMYKCFITTKNNGNKMETGEGGSEVKEIVTVEGLQLQAGELGGGKRGKETGAQVGTQEGLQGSVHGGAQGIKGEAIQTGTQGAGQGSKGEAIQTGTQGAGQGSKGEAIQTGIQGAGQGSKVERMQRGIQEAGQGSKVERMQRGIQEAGQGSKVERMQRGIQEAEQGKKVERMQRGIQEAGQGKKGDKEEDAQEGNEEDAQGNEEGVDEVDEGENEDGGEGIDETYDEQLEAEEGDREIADKEEADMEAAYIEQQELNEMKEAKSKVVDSEDLSNDTNGNGSNGYSTSVGSNGESSKESINRRSNRQRKRQRNRRRNRKRNRRRNRSNSKRNNNASSYKIKKNILEGKKSINGTSNLRDIENHRYTNVVNNKNEYTSMDSNEAIYEERKQKILLIHLLKNIKDLLYRQKKNFNNFLSFLSENYASYEKFNSVRKNVNFINSGRYNSGGSYSSDKRNVGNTQQVGETGDDYLSESFLSLSDKQYTKKNGMSNVSIKNVGNKYKNESETLKSEIYDSRELEEEENDQVDDKKEDDIQDDESNDDVYDKKKDPKKFGQIKEMLQKVLEIKDLTDKQKEYLKVIIKVLELEDDLLNKEKLQLELDKNIINLLMGKSNELRNIAVQLSKEKGENEGSQRVDLAQNIVSNLLNFSVELKNTGNIVYNNMQGQGEMLQNVEKNIHKAEEQLKNVRVHTEYRNRDTPKEDPSDDHPSDDDNPSNDNSSDDNPNDNNTDGAKAIIDNKDFIQYCNENDEICKKSYSPLKNTKGGQYYGSTTYTVNTPYNYKKFKLNESMKNHFFNIFVKESAMLKKLYKLLYELF
ncbi:rhoptry-associated leucine zipper-like protein 1 [Plasmodium brasilianum]|uniref:Rhoptry-associated leucine zipper-like protein 1 n=1 Tax=Plasmodium brasilianum TaxID=5824 RepID=A0ACB9YGL2_PLABR|nr:rhoptry-associated leucine zipper-like protein 1 [Plasmodium brasilianum]